MISVLWIHRKKSGDCCQVSRGSGWNQGTGATGGVKKHPKSICRVVHTQKSLKPMIFWLWKWLFFECYSLDAQKVESQQCLDTWFFWLHAGVTQISRDIAGTLHPDQPGQPELQPRPQRSGAFKKVIPNFPSVLSVKKVMVFSFCVFPNTFGDFVAWRTFWAPWIWPLIPSISSQEGLEHIKQWNSVHLLSEDATWTKHNLTSPGPNSGETSLGFCSAWFPPYTCGSLPSLKKKRVMKDKHIKSTVQDAHQKRQITVAKQEYPWHVSKLLRQPSFFFVGEQIFNRGGFWGHEGRAGWDTKKVFAKFLDCSSSFVKPVFVFFPKRRTDGVHVL